jgi:hypothetical protein
VPTWQTSLRHARELRRTETELAQLNQWSVAGLWLEHALAERQPAVEGEYARLVPPNRDKERLFLELARVADRSGVSAFDLEEEEQPPGMGDDAWGGGTPPPGSSPDAPPLDIPSLDAPPLDGAAVGGGEAPLPEIPVHAYRVEARFVGDFPQVARFLAELQRIPRALSLSRLTAYTASQGIEVELELDFYVDAEQ